MREEAGGEEEDRVRALFLLVKVGEIRVRLRAQGKGGGRRGATTTEPDHRAGQTAEPWEEKEYLLPKTG